MLAHVEEVNVEFVIIEVLPETQMINRVGVDALYLSSNVDASLTILRDVSKPFVTGLIHVILEYTMHDVGSFFEK